MDLVAKTAVGKYEARSRFVPSVVEPMELSVRTDSAKSDLEKARRARLAAAEGRVDIATVDEKAVDEAAAWITAKIAVTLRRGAQEVGEYVLGGERSSREGVVVPRAPTSSRSRACDDTEGGLQGTPVHTDYAQDAQPRAQRLQLRGEQAGFSKAHVEELDGEQRKGALASAQTLVERLRDLVGKLRAV